MTNQLRRAATRCPRSWPSGRPVDARFPNRARKRADTSGCQAAPLTRDGVVVRVLGIDVTDDVIERWCGYLAPEMQPFFLGVDDEFAVPQLEVEPSLTADLRCTYTAWRVLDSLNAAWFDEESFMALPRADRARLVRLQAEKRRGAVPTVRRWQHDFDVERLRGQADGYRFVWWPSLLGNNPEPVLRAHVEDGQLASRHEEVGDATWRRCRDVVPGAQELVGGFPESSGPNCFGATLAAAGRPCLGGRALQCDLESFLTESCRPGGRDGDPGTVLVWRDRDGVPVHSAVTIGDGWAVEKPAETWWTPTIVAEVGQVVRVNRSVGLRLERHTILT